MPPKLSWRCTRVHRVRTVFAWVGCLPFLQQHFGPYRRRNRRSGGSSGDEAGADLTGTDLAGTDTGETTWTGVSVRVLPVPDGVTAKSICSIAEIIVEPAGDVAGCAERSGGCPPTPILSGVSPDVPSSRAGRADGRPPRRWRPSIVPIVCFSFENRSFSEEDEMRVGNW